MPKLFRAARTPPGQRGPRTWVETQGMNTFTVAEAAEATGKTQKSIRRRIERGTLRSTLGADSLRRIPESELIRAGLLGPGGEVQRGTEGNGVPRGTPAGQSADLSVLLERLEALAAENGRLRALEERAGSLERQVAAERDARERVEVALAEAQLKLETRPQRWWRRPRTARAAAST